MTTREDPVRRVLLGAADLIERCGLLKGDYWPGHLDHLPYVDGDPCCSYGAVLVTVDATYRSERVKIAARGRLRHHLRGRGPGTIAEWNDHPDRTKDEVVAMLRAAAA